MDKTHIAPNIIEKDINYYLRIIRGDFSEFEETRPVKAESAVYQKNIVLLINGESWGKGNEELGKRLIAFFLQTLINQRIKPKSVILINSGVLLASKTSEVLNKLIMLEEQAIKIMVCVISADDYKVSDTLKVGMLTDMDTICENLLSAWKVITL